MEWLGIIIPLGLVTGGGVVSIIAWHLDDLYDWAQSRKARRIERAEAKRKALEPPHIETHHEYVMRTNAEEAAKWNAVFEYLNTDKKGNTNDATLD